MTSLQKQIRKELESRGLRWNPTDAAAFIEEIAPVRSREALGAALSYLRPFSSQVGYRVARLSDQAVEVLVPARRRNFNEESVFHEGVLVTAAIEACKLLWVRHAPIGDFHAEVRSLSAKIHRPSGLELRGRADLSEAVREGVLSQLRQQRRAEADMDLRFFDRSEQLIAEVSLSLKFAHTPQLEVPEV